MKEFPPFLLDDEGQCLWRGNERVTLTPKAFSILNYMVTRAGRLITQKELLEALWPDTFVQPDVLKSHILDVRSALGDDARNPTFIETQQRRGYRFIAKVQDSAARAPRWNATLAKAAADSTEREASIAVLPFSDMSSSKEFEYFSDGLAEEIINALTKVSGLRVIARTSAFAFKRQNKDIRRIAEALGVANILEGSVRIERNRVRVAAQLIAASDGSHVWSGSYDRGMTDIFAIQDEISHAIAEALETRLGRKVKRLASARQPANPEAYQAYLEGRYYMHQVTPIGIARALECYERAIRLDPGYALPHAGLAERVYYQAIYLSARPREIVPAALASLARALQLDPSASDAHLARGIFSAFYEYNWKAADEHFAQAMELDPACPRVRSARSFWLLAPTGRFEEALAEIKRAVNLDPLSSVVRNREITILQSMRKPEALERARATLQMFPAHPVSSFAGSLAFLGPGLHDEAATTLEKGLEAVPGSVYLLGALALARGRQLRDADARQIRSQLEELAARQYIPFLPRACASEACGDMDGAYHFLDQAIEEREPLAIPVLTARRAELSADPQYESLLRKMNLA
jgi:TolB-like protein/Flp pilus assembly protein TadD